jgi:hypothetical protein
MSRFGQGPKCALLATGFCLRLFDFSLLFDPWPFFRCSFLNCFYFPQYYFREHGLLRSWLPRCSSDDLKLTQNPVPSADRRPLTT